MSRVKKISKVTIFIVFLVIIISTIGNIVRFKFLSFDSSRLDATDMYYDQPENTIEVVFVGTSVVLNGFSPLDLYDMYGICAYNFGTPGQATMTSYYWVEDTYRNHEESLAAVVFDVSYLRTIPADARYQLPAQKLDMSMTKMNLIKDSADTIDDFMNLISYTFSYHTRWKELVSADFGVGVSDIINTRGYEYYSYKMINGTTYDQINTANYFLEEVEEETVLPEEALFYLDKLVSFCEEASIDLILVKTPADGWEDGDHLAIQSIADEYNLEFIDFNYSDYFEALEFNFATDTIDGIHANYYGASKLTSYLGEYLVNNSNVTDVRNQEGFIFMDEELEEYKRNIVKMDLEEIIDPIEYISYISSKENYTLLITVADEASTSLLEEQRESLVELGLVELSGIEYQSSYIGVIENGIVTYEAIEKEEEVTNTEEATCIMYTNVLEDGSEYTLLSGGFNLGNLSSCKIDEVQYSLNQRGINIVVYDNETSEVVDVAVFDTHASSTRLPQNISLQLETLLNNGATLENLTGTVRELYLYNLVCEDTFKIKSIEEEFGETGFYKCLSEFYEDENYIIFLSSYGEVTGLFDNQIREKFEELGLVELSELEEGGFYGAIIDSGVVIAEETTYEELVDIVIFEYEVISGEDESNYTSSIEIGTDVYTFENQGINIVIYNKTTDLIVATKTFNTDTYAVAIE